MAKTVLGIARFSNFELFDNEAIARDWLERADSAPSTPVSGGGGVKKFAVPAAVVVSGVLVRRVRRRRAGAA
jgi:hypothetical protein